MCPRNVNGEKISSENNIKVIELNDKPFKLIVHHIFVGSPDPLFEDIPSRIIKNPEIWNTKEGATTLSTTVISNSCIKTFGVNQPGAHIYYGFNELPFDVLRGTISGDAGTLHGGGQLEALSGTNKVNTLDYLINVTTAHSPYNEIVLMRRSPIKNKFDGNEIKVKAGVDVAGLITNTTFSAVYASNNLKENKNKIGTVNVKCKIAF